jgi:hypothetical protein
MGPAYVLWWVPTGHRPRWAEAKLRLRELDVHGPTRRAFTFTKAFQADGTAVSLNSTDNDRNSLTEA